MYGEIYWRLTSEKPAYDNCYILAEDLDGKIGESFIDDHDAFDQWCESIIRWAYEPRWFNEHFSKQMNPPEEEEKDVKKDDKMSDNFANDDVDRRYCMGHWFSRISNSDGDDRWKVDEVFEHFMAERQSRLSESFKDKTEGAGDEEDSLESESISNKYAFDSEAKRLFDQHTYTRIRNRYYYKHAGAKGVDGGCYSRRTAIEQVLEKHPSLEEAARKLDPWFFDD